MTQEPRLESNVSAECVSMDKVGIIIVFNATHPSTLVQSLISDSPFFAAGSPAP